MTDPGHQVPTVAGLAAAERIVRGWVDDGLVSAAGLACGRGVDDPWIRSVGRQRLGDEPGTLRDDALFLVASITKPVVAMAVLALVEEGAVALGDRVERFLPEFGAAGKHRITVRHLLTHTSGLPDMLPHNRSLRERNAPLAEFVAGTVAAGVDFEPGRGAQYQSMGFALLGAIVERITSRPLSRFCEERLFAPLGMTRSFLGLPDERFGELAETVVEVDVPTEQEGAGDWGWSSPYWRRLGAPWGGLLTTPGDLATFARTMLSHGEGPHGRVFSSATVEAATRNQLLTFPDVPETDRRCRGWGFGWRMQWATHAATFGDLCGPRTYGHFGATGTVLWIDPDLDAYGIVLTTTPFDPRQVPLSRVSNAFVASLAD